MVEVFDVLRGRQMSDHPDNPLHKRTRDSSEETRSVSPFPVSRHGGRGSDPTRVREDGERPSGRRRHVTDLFPQRTFPGSSLSGF